MTRFMLLFFFIPVITLLSGAASASDVGFKTLSLSAENPDQRALKGGIWYPSQDDQPTQKIADNIVFFGEDVRPNATPLAGHHALVILSHGLSGNWRNQGWLATELVRQGRIVVAINHPGTTSRDMQPKEGRMLWKRPQDIHQVITALTTDPAWSPLIKADDIAVIGHSLGGWTALEVAGAQMDAKRMLDDCATHPELAACDMVVDFGVGETASDQKSLAQSGREPTVSKVVSIDLGLARGFTPESLTKIYIPVLLIAAGSPNPKVPHALETGYLNKYLPGASTDVHVIEQAGHFSFLPQCKPGAIPILENDVPGDGIICQDGDAPQEDVRQKVHQQATKLIIDFLDRKN